MYADLLYQLLTQPDLDGNHCRVITVATHRAQSAAAIFLARGEYAIAYQTASIHFHGIRQQALVTTESAAMLASTLQSYNDRYAIDMARSSMHRFIWIINSFSKELPPITEPTFTRTFGKWLTKKVSKKNAELIRRALAKYDDAEKLSNHVLAHLEKSKKKQLTRGARDVAIMKTILDFELKSQPKTWTLSINQLRNDYLQFHDYQWGQHKAGLPRMVASLLVLLLPYEDQQKYTALPDTERDEWIEARLKPLAEPLWYFVLSLCRLLYEGENPIGVEEAYWLGLIDEVAGSDLPSIRRLIEKTSNPDPPVEALPTTPVPAPGG